MAEPIFWSLVETGPTTAGWLVGEGLEFLSPAENQILAGLRFERRRAEWLLGRWCAKRIVLTATEGELCRALSTISILNDTGGAPYVVNHESERIPGCLSISHRAGTAACAWTNDSLSSIGIDVELVEQRDPSFLGDYYTQIEQDFANALPAHVKDLWITLAWSAKESVLKVLRTGLRIDTRKIQIANVRGLFQGAGGEPTWNSLSVRYDQADDGIWQAYWQVRGALVITLVVRGKSQPVVIQEI